MGIYCSCVKPLAVREMVNDENEESDNVTEESDNVTEESDNVTEESDNVSEAASDKHVVFRRKHIQRPVKIPVRIISTNNIIYAHHLCTQAHILEKNTDLSAFERKHQQGILIRRANVQLRTPDMS